MPAQSPANDLRRVIGFFGGTALIVGITIGSGIFRTPPTIAGLVPHPRVWDTKLNVSGPAFAANSDYTLSFDESFTDSKGVRQSNTYSWTFRTGN